MIGRPEKRHHGTVQNRANGGVQVFKPKPAVGVVQTSVDGDGQDQEAWQGTGQSTYGPQVSVNIRDFGMLYEGAAPVVRARHN